jgi:nitroimidazol reductase NimA-like FMN-containing flavoprotein (pyridoxamine 5'-phosphate oxidase superfamily)
MRNTEREIKDREEILSIMKEAQVCRIAFSAENIPYIVPMNFGYQDNCLYFHCAREGKKLDIIHENNQVCFEIDINDELVKKTERLCSWTTKYRSVIGFGKAFIIEN